jgi:hypothetical protein
VLCYLKRDLVASKKVGKGKKEKEARKNEKEKGDRKLVRDRHDP